MPQICPSKTGIITFSIKSSFLLPAHQVLDTYSGHRARALLHAGHRHKLNYGCLHCCPRCAAEFGGSLDATGLLDFVDAGHDLFLAIDPDASDELRELAADLGVDFDTKGSVITDHFNRHDQQQSAIVTGSALESKIVFGSSHKHVKILCYAVSLSGASGKTASLTMHHIARCDCRLQLFTEG